MKKKIASLAIFTLSVTGLGFTASINTAVAADDFCITGWYLYEDYGIARQYHCSFGDLMMNCEVNPGTGQENCGTPYPAN